MLEEPIYSFLWKSVHTKDYLIDFLNAYFHFNDHTTITNLEFIDSSLFTNDMEIQKRIHITFMRGEERYYYEIKFVNEAEASVYFDFSLLPFANYCWNVGALKQHIGQFVLNFKDTGTVDPIQYFMMKNDTIDDDGIEVHILSLSLLSKILSDKSPLELNRFERWILLFSATSSSEVKDVVKPYPIMRTFLYLWSQESKRVLICENNQSDEKRNAYLFEEACENKTLQIAIQLLQEHCSLETIQNVTGLSISEIVSLQEMMDQD